MQHNKVYKPSYHLVTISKRNFRINVTFWEICNSRMHTHTFSTISIGFHFCVGGKTNECTPVPGLPWYSTSETQTADSQKNQMKMRLVDTFVIITPRTPVCICLSRVVWSYCNHSVIAFARRPFLLHVNFKRKSWRMCVPFDIFLVPLVFVFVCAHDTMWIVEYQMGVISMRINPWCRVSSERETRRMPAQNFWSSWMEKKKKNMMEGVCWETWNGLRLGICLMCVRLKWEASANGVTEMIMFGRLWFVRVWLFYPILHSLDINPYYTRVSKPPNISYNHKTTTSASDERSAQMKNWIRCAVNWRCRWSLAGRWFVCMTTTWMEIFHAKIADARADMHDARA